MEIKLSELLRLSIWDRFDLRGIQKWLLRLLWGPAIFAAVSCLSILVPSSAPKNPSEAGTLRDTQRLEPLNTYEASLKNENLFGSYFHKEGTAGVVKNSTVDELVKDFRLKGVIMGDAPEAIMEDARIQKTSFVKAGDTLGALTVKTIKEDSILLSSGPEEKELRMQ